MAEICGARNRQGGPCRRPAGWGTDHPGRGRCKLHGGKSPGGAPGNKNAVTTGAKESIFLDTLDDDEQALFGEVDVGVAKLLEEELRLTAIRERRMLQRIAALKAHTMTVVELVEETEAEAEDGVKPESGQGSGRPVVRRKMTGTLGQIQAVEEALTRVQLHKARLIDLKHRLEQGGGPQTGNIQAYVDALAGAGAQVWAGEPTGEDGGDA